MSRRVVLARLVLTLCCTLAGSLASAQLARADVFGSFSLLSTGIGEQVTYARDATVSADGRFVAFDGDFAGQTGVWRRGIAGGPLEPVSVGEPGTPQGAAELPSISADGRYVSFTTTAALVAEDGNAAPDVYVRDMQATGEGAYQLASAIDIEGSTVGLTYTYGANPAFEETHFGAVAAGRTALSADGQRVAFVTTAISDLAGTATPALQVAVRDLRSRSTQLVSVRYDPASGAPAIDPETGGAEPVAAREGSETYGAVFTGAGAAPPSFTVPGPYDVASPVGASISADGSTVAWVGVNVGLQAPMLPAESVAAKYNEPLWRRITGGSQAPARRVTGGSDPSAPACLASGEASLPVVHSPGDPCQGPFDTLAEPATPGIVSTIEGDVVVPRLSADGYTVAFVANAPLVALGQNFGQGGDTHSDLYLADMHEGLTRTQALRQLTELASGDILDLATTAPIIDFGVSPDGSEIAFSTKRTQFPLGSPAYVTAPSAAPGMAELFDVDLANDTLTRVTQGFEGGPSAHPHVTHIAGEDPYVEIDDGALSPSFSGDGNLLTFSSTASNLVYGDGNTPPAVANAAFDGSDVFGVSRVVFGSAPTSQSVGPAPANPALTPTWRLGVTARSRRDGSVLLEVLVPGAGTLRAAAAGTVRLRVARGGHGARSASSRRRGAMRVASVTVASRTTRSQGGGLVALTLKLAKRFGSLAGRRGGLSATATVTFTAPHHATLREALTLDFARTVKARRSGRATRKAERAR
jgi:Tol biopolymer transport system component